MRFNPLNLAKIVCFAKWVKGAKCVSSDLLNEKVLMILTCEGSINSKAPKESDASLSNDSVGFKRKV